MSQSVTFHGASGKANAFHKVALYDRWDLFPGVAIFAAPDAYGWRVIRVIELTGRPHDVRLVWALTEAERYGANAVFVADVSNHGERVAMIDDLELGLNPVVTRSLTPAAIALAA